MRKLVWAIVAAGAVIALTGGAAAVAGANGSEGTITSPEAERAVRAALEASGGGTVGEVELDGDDGAPWEVEVTRPDGSTVDIRLDDRYRVVVIEGDQEATDGDDGPGEDES
jgi:hypothetical protein